MSVWIWIAATVAVDALCWGILLKRSRAMAREHEEMLERSSRRVKIALDAPRGDQPRILGQIHRDLVAYLKGVR